MTDLRDQLADFEAAARRRPPRPCPTRRDNCLCADRADCRIPDDAYHGKFPADDRRCPTSTTPTTGDTA